METMSNLRNFLSGETSQKWIMKVPMCIPRRKNQKLHRTVDGLVEMSSVGLKWFWICLRSNKSGTHLEFK